VFRYIAFIWNDHEPGARRAAHALAARFGTESGRWRRVFSAGGAEVRCAGEFPGRSEARRLAGGLGVILGSLFVRDAAEGSVAAPRMLAAAQSAAIVSSGGRTLVESYWGRYVAVWRDPRSGALGVLRDPSAGLPCYALRVGPIEVFCSRIEDAAGLCSQPLQPDWSYVMACLSLVREHSGPTGLREVRQLVGGECVRHCAGTTIRGYAWDPLQIASRQLIEDPRTAAAEVGHCVRDVVRAWGAGAGRVLLSLSGGLDSSIVLASLAPGRETELIGYHYYPLRADLDERQFARLAAARAGIRLIERPRSPGFDLRPLLSIPATAEPTNYPYYLEHSRREAALAAECAAASVFIGYGGDQLFYQERAQWAPGDFLHRRGPRPGLLRVLLDSARMDQLSLWRVLGITARETLGVRRWSPVCEAGRARGLLAAGVVATAVRQGYCLHPLLHRARDVPSGKLWHAHQILSPFDFYDPLGVPGDPERLAPLLSQPLMELCLRIPVDVLTTGGWDRALVRQAFYDALPPQIRNRRNKGGIEMHMRLTVERNRALLRELLLDGMLVANGLLDRSAVERALAGRAEIETQSGELIEYACIESWLERWHARDSSRRPGVWQTVT
jgi:asparagine synthase (glutamine-hydrolysing)